MICALHIADFNNKKKKEELVEGGHICKDLYLCEEQKHVKHGWNVASKVKSEKR